MHPGKGEKTLKGDPLTEFTYGPLDLHDLNYVSKADYWKTVRYILKDRSKPDEYCTWSSMDKESVNKPARESKTETYFREHAETIIKGNLSELDPYFIFTHASKIMKIRDLFNKPQKREFKPKGVFIWGAPGLGKTSLIKRWFRSETWAEKPKNGDWFVQYQGEKIIILDEIDPEYVLKYGTNLNQWTDGYDCVVPIKGGFTTISHDFFVMISNYSPFQLWGEMGPEGANNPYRQMQRRLISKEFHHIPEEFDCNNKQHVIQFMKLIFGNRAEEVKEYLEPDIAELW